MKFVYADESGEQDHSCVFTMVGVMVDAVRLRKKTEDFDNLWQELLSQHPEETIEIKTSRMINGKGAWSKVCPDVRKAFISNVIDLATNNGGKIFAYAIDFEKIKAINPDDYKLPFEKHKWTSAAMYIAALIQKKMQTVKGKKGLTVLVMDDNQHKMPTLTDGLYRCDTWYDGLYEMRGKKRGKTIWVSRKPADRFDQIINTAFAIKSEHSTFVQVADVISYVYRRHYELLREDEAYAGEKALYAAWVESLEASRVRLGHIRKCDAGDFYHEIVPDGWSL